MSEPPFFFVIRFKSNNILINFLSVNIIQLCFFPFFYFIILRQFLNIIDCSAPHSNISIFRPVFVSSVEFRQIFLKFFCILFLIDSFSIFVFIIGKVLRNKWSREKELIARMFWTATVHIEPLVYASETKRILL